MLSYNLLVNLPFCPLDESMHFTLVIRFRSGPETQNYAVAPARRSAVTEPAGETDVLANQVCARYRAWLCLYRDPAVWSDPQKRRAMVRAWLDFADASAAYDMARKAQFLNQDAYLLR